GRVVDVENPVAAGQLGEVLGGALSVAGADHGADRSTFVLHKDRSHVIGVLVMEAGVEPTRHPSDAAIDQPGETVEAVNAGGKPHPTPGFASQMPALPVRLHPDLSHGTDGLN